MCSCVRWLDSHTDVLHFRACKRLYLILPRPLDNSQPNVQSPSSFHFYDSVYAGVVDGTQPLVALEEAREVQAQYHNNLNSYTRIIGYRSQKQRSPMTLLRSEQVIDLLRRCRESAGGVVQQRQRL